MATAVSIANKALTRLGVDPITAFTDNTPQGRAVNRIYEALRRELVSAHVWNFALRKASIAALSTVPTHTFARAFQLPSDCLRLLDVVTDDLYGVFGTTIETDAVAPLAITYIADISDPNQMPAYFRRALSLHLAADLAFLLTANATLAQSMESLAVSAESLARSYDAQEGEIDVQDEGTWLEARL